MTSLITGLVGAVVFMISMLELIGSVVDEDPVSIDCEAKE